MRKYSWLLAAVISLFMAISVQAAGLQDAKGQADKKLDELRQFDRTNAELRIEWEKAAAYLAQLKSSADGKRALFEQAKDAYDKAEKSVLTANERAILAETRNKAELEWHTAYAVLSRYQETVQPLEAKYAWKRYDRLKMTADALNLLAAVYDAGSANTFYSEGSAQMTGSKDQSSTVEKQVVSLAEADALEKAGKTVIESISPAEVLTLLEQDTVTGAVEKVATDVTGSYGKVQKSAAGDVVHFAARVRLEVRQQTLNPYRTAATSRVETAKTMYTEYLRKYPVFALAPMQWEGKLISLQANGEPTAEASIRSWNGMIADGKLRMSPEILERDYKEINVPFQLLVSLNLPQAISGDQAKLEIVLNDQSKGMKRMSVELIGSSGSASYAYQSFVPPIITLTAGNTSLPNSRLRVGESIIRFDSQRSSVVSFELKDGEVAAYSADKLTRKMAYEGKVGQLNSIRISVPGYAAIDSIKLYDNGVLVFREEFNRESNSGIMLNTMWK